MGRKKLWAVSGLIDEAFSLNYMTDVPPGTDRNWFMLFVSLYLYISWIGVLLLVQFLLVKPLWTSRSGLCNDSPVYRDIY